MKNTIKIIAATCLFTLSLSIQNFAQKAQNKFNLSIDFDGGIDLAIGNNFEIKLYNGLTKELLKDELIQSDDDFSFQIKNEEVFVDGKRLYGRNFHKYRDIAREDLNDPRQFHLVWEEGKLTRLQIRTDS